MSTFLNDMPWVIFNLLDEQFAVSTSYVREMVAMPKVVTVPRTPDYIKGVINLRGKVIPVMDLRMRMGMESMAVGVDSVKTVEKLSEANIEDLPGVTSSLDNESIAGIGQRGENNELFQLLDVGILIT